jgi:outer membrane receptor for ferrienterochelin and colicin
VRVGHDPAGARLAANRAKVELTWFNNRYQDRVSTRTTNPATFEAQYFNIGLSRARGAEAAVEVAPPSSPSTAVTSCCT